MIHRDLDPTKCVFLKAVLLFRCTFIRKKPGRRKWFIVNCLLAFHWICFPLLRSQSDAVFLHYAFIYFHEVNAFRLSKILPIICFCFSILMQFNLFDAKGIKNKWSIILRGKASWCISCQIRQEKISGLRQMKTIHVLSDHDLTFLSKMQCFVDDWVICTFTKTGDTKDLYFLKSSS